MVFVMNKNSLTDVVVVSRTLGAATYQFPSSVGVTAEVTSRVRTSSTGVDEIPEEQYKPKDLKKGVGGRDTILSTRRSWNSSTEWTQVGYYQRSTEQLTICL